MKTEILITELGLIYKKLFEEKRFFEAGRINLAIGVLEQIGIQEKIII